MQLVAYGAQDVYLSGNPQITFFKVVYRRHTNFSVEPIQQTWNGAADFGRTVTCNINRNGDLITNMYVAVKLNAAAKAAGVNWGYVRRLGHAMVESCKVEIGGSKIDEHYGDWLNVWYELTHKSGQERGYAKMIGDINELTNIDNTALKAYQMYVPLQFWFNRNNGLALPLIALQYHDVRVTLKFRDFSGCVNYAGTSASSAPSGTGLMSDSYLLIDYVYLDSEERKRFAQASHEYLIEQLQFTGSESLTAATAKYRLNFNHPCKYLVWVPHLERHVTRQNWIAWAAGSTTWKEASDRFAKILYLGTRFTVNVTLPSAGAAGTVTVRKTGAAALGDLIETDTIATPNALVTALLAKVEVKLNIKAAAPANLANLGGDANTESAPVVGTVVAGSTNSDLLNEVLNNMVIVRNDLNFEDLSNTVSQLTVANGVNSAVANLASLNVVDHFNYGNFVNGSDNPVYSAKLQLNGHDRFQDRDGNYFNYVQPYQHFSNTPADGVNVYSFALKAEDHQPTGTCNFSRIDNATLQIQVGLYNNTSTNYTSNWLGSSQSSFVNIYTQNYNVLRVMSGMAGTAYSN